jgi:peptidoglycan/LPS O-acetylase OafA/YrhL
VASPQSNNFDLIRLAAALQVAYSHCAALFGTLHADKPFSTLVAMFPGVPVFFFVSGFLISKSFENNSNWREYAWNRVLRIYPALVVCFVLSLCALWLCGWFNSTEVPHGQFVAWVVAQLTVGQFYNPSFVSRAPLWALNGSVWTITVELQFYVLVPLIYRCLRIEALSRRRANIVLAAAILVSLAVSELWVWKNPGAGGRLGPQILVALFVPWFYMFLVGVFFQRNSAFFQRWLAGRFIYLFVAYSALSLLANRDLHWQLKDSPHPLLFCGLALVTFSAAFSSPTLSDRLLRRNDLSYGLYIYHLPVANVILLTGLLAGHAATSAALVLSLAFAYASWRLIEKPTLALKRHPLYQHRAST